MLAGCPCGDGELTVKYTSLEFSGNIKAECRDFKVTCSETVIFKARILDEVIRGK